MRSLLCERAPRPRSDVFAEHAAVWQSAQRIERHFERMPRTSALPPISDAFLSRSKRRLGRLLEVTSDPVDLIAGSTERPATGFRLTALATEATHRVTGVAAFILLTN